MGSPLDFLSSMDNTTALIAGNVDNMVNRDAVSRQNSRDKTAAYEAWALQTFYNSPLMERLRLEQAGINPAVYYSSNGSGGSAGTIDLPQTKTPFPSNVGENFSKFASANLAATSALTDVAAKEQSMELTKAQVDQSRALTAKTLVESAKTQQDKEQSAGLYQSTLDQAEAGVNKTLADTDLAVVNARKGLQDTQQSADMFPDTRKGKQLDNALKQTELALKQEGKTYNLEILRNTMNKIANETNLQLQMEQINKLEVQLSKAGLSGGKLTQIMAIISHAILRK